MKYLIRLNPKALNPLPGKINAKRLWEVEQCQSKDSEKVIWHCADVRIGSTPMREFFVLAKPGEKPFELTVFGICYRGADDAIVIDERKGHDVQ